MTDLYLTNRNKANEYLSYVKSQLDQSIQPETFPSAADANLQPFYLEYKQRILAFVERETAKLQQKLLETENSHLMLLMRTRLVDSVVQNAFDIALWLFQQKNESQIKAEDLPVAIIARGGYGREEMYFQSNVDLKIVFRDIENQKQIGFAAEVVSYFEYLFVFQDIFQTTSRTGCSEVETYEQELDDTTLSSLFSLMENRMVTGNPMVYKEFADSILAASQLHHDKILEYCHQRKGYYDIQNTVFCQEPNIKEELGRIYWALGLARIRFSIEQKNHFELLSILYEQNHISPPAFKKAQAAMDFLSSVRLILHCHQTGSQRDVLSYEVRDIVAKAKGYDVKEFFDKYFFHSVLPLKRFSRNLFWESLTPESNKVKNLSPDFAINAENQIIFSQKREDYTWSPPHSILEIFVWVARKNYVLSYPVILNIEQNVDQMSPIFRSEDDTEAVRQFFQNILRGKFFAKAMRYLHEFGLLDQFFIPEFKNLSGLLQDIYVHIFPTDIHVLAALDALNRLDHDPEADSFLIDLYQSLRDKSTIRLAVMLHDIGKGLKAEGENEELVGSRAIPHILERLGYPHNVKLVRDVAFLVEKHLMMRDLMLLDPDEDDTYEMIWDLVTKDVERLKMLILLTYADRAATKMNMSQAQIDQLKYFYQNTLYHKKRESVTQPVKQEFLRMIRLPREMQSQLEIYNEFKKSRDQFATEIFFKSDQPSELIVCVKDQPSLLFKVATVLAFNNLSIVDARIHTYDDNVFDIFQISDGSGNPIEFSGFYTVQKQVKEDLRKVFVGNLPVSSLYKGRSLVAQAQDDKLRDVKLKVSIIGRAVKVETHDILGTMMVETKVFSQLNMEIQRAVIHSSYENASNIFYLRPEDVHEIIKHEDKFKTMLKNALEPLIKPEPVFPDSPAEVA